MKHSQKHVVNADPLSQIEQTFWRYLTKKIAESKGPAKEFHIPTVEAYQCSYGQEPKNLSAAAQAISDILESLRTKGMWANLNGNELTRIGYISGTTVFPRRPEIVAFTIDDGLSQLICSEQ